MNKDLYNKMYTLLEEKARNNIHADIEITEKVKNMNEIVNLMNILNNFEELEPLLKKYFKEKAEKEKWKNDGR